MVVDKFEEFVSEIQQINAKSLSVPEIIALASEPFHTSMSLLQFIKRDPTFIVVNWDTTKIPEEITVERISREADDKPAELEIIRWSFVLGAPLMHTKFTNDKISEISEKLFKLKENHQCYDI